MDSKIINTLDGQDQFYLQSRNATTFIINPNTYIINGKYKTNGTLAGSHEKMIEVMDKLIKEESAKK